MENEILTPEELESLLTKKLQETPLYVFTDANNKDKSITIYGRYEKIPHKQMLKGGSYVLIDGPRIEQNVFENGYIYQNQLHLPESILLEHYRKLYEKLKNNGSIG